MNSASAGSREGNVWVPAIVFSLFFLCSAAYLVAARFPDTEPSAPAPDRACAEALAQAGLDHACGVLLRLADAGGFQPEVWDAILATGGVVPALGTETRVEAVSAGPSMPGRMAYRVRVRMVESARRRAGDLAVHITSVGVYVPPGPGSEEIVSMAETAFELTRPTSRADGAADGILVAARR